MNYSELLDAVKSTVQNYEADFVSQLPVMVRVAEQRIYNSVQLPVQRQNVEGNLTQGSPYLTLPPGFLAPYSLATKDADGAQSYLLFKEVEYIREAYPPPNTLGAPKVYAVFDEDTIIVGPTPNQSYQVQLHYNGYPESIVTAGTSWLGNYFESVLLYATLVEAAVFMKEEQDVVAMYTKLFDESMVQLKLLGSAKLKQDGYRVPAI
jgi:hypothetical protein